MHKVFISYYHAADQKYKDALVSLAEKEQIFIDGSVDTGDIDDEGMSDEAIRVKIRDEYLRETSVTIVLVGPETKTRKHVDWEIYSSMIDGKINKKSGIIVILLPEAQSPYFTAAHQEEKAVVYPDQKDWVHIDSEGEYQRRYPHLPPRLIDNLLNNEAMISVINWNDISPEKLRFMIDCAYNDRTKCKYTLSRPRKKRNG